MDAQKVAQALGVIPEIEVAPLEYPARGSHLEVKASPATVVRVAEVLDEQGFFIEAITGVDWLGEQEAKAKEAAKAAKEKAKEQGGEGEGAPPAGTEESPEAVLPEDEFEVVYDFNRYESLCRVTVRVRVPRSVAEVPMISSIYPGADWHERETHDFFGIRFAGHPCLKPLLLPDDADFHPLRKDYTP